ncbi:NAD(P)-dependent alcohol dehydrogenase [Sphingomonas naphthae]|uniref:NAD(P)-dependent alcohol dehydrogenase n=1 Tax=Sphingomonas naphthae TaxID=1813468 RepID=A0ABY7TLE5_9SPHN|nr:NAD(P)-dependent alcohol dehydrogenase [Sphingomonas naphthae]WCT73770.1 NAD(P)-dependent alcohol dehydrogenase [Sphingomonas naphthae]
MKISAAVVREAGAPFAIETLSLEEPRADEVRVRIVATGLCHTDLVVRDQVLPTPLPAVLGHEGAGIVEAVGADVTDLKVGDPVVLGFAACRECTPCRAGEPSYCAHFAALNFGGCRDDGSVALADAAAPVSSHFFGQSSFATHALVAAKNVVKVPADAPLDILGPLGCGLMTGAGAILNTLAVQAGQSVLVSGGGPVGLAGVMAAASAAAGTIILVDPLESRRTLALELGATHAIDPMAGPLGDQVRAILPEGVARILETSGNTGAIEQSVGVLGARGRLAMVGVPKTLDATITIAALPLVSLGASICGVTEGDADPRSFIPHLIALHREGRFPFDRLITRYPLAEINSAIADQYAGVCVKAVLTM